MEAWKKLIQTKNFKNIVWPWGHHPLASLSYIVFYFSVSVLTVTGMMLSAIEHNRGPLATWFYDELVYKHTTKEIHEVFSWMVLIFIITHIAALFYHENEDGVPVVQSMFSGFQYKKEEKKDE
jgi:cytochrome b